MSERRVPARQATLRRAGQRRDKLVQASESRFGPGGLLSTAHVPFAPLDLVTRSALVPAL